MPDISSLNAEIDRLTQAVGFWNTAIIVLMIGVAVAATGLVVVQQKAFKTADALAAATTQLSTLKEAISDQKIAEALKQAGESNKAAAEANERAGKAQASLGLAEQHAAEANSKAEGFRLNIAEANARAAEANLALEKLKTPRQLTSEQQAKIVAILTAWSGQRFSFSVAGDTEALNLLNTLRGVLAKSGWVKEVPVGFGDVSIGDAAAAYGTGVIIRFSPSATPETMEIASSFAEALAANGIASKPERDARVSDPKLLNVLVGTKPLR